MQHPDEGMIHTWLDGELSAEEAAAFEAHVSECAECTKAVAEARGLIAASSRIVSSLDVVPRGVIPVAKPARRAWYATTQFRAAAALLLVAGTSLVLARSGSESNSAGIADKAMTVTTAQPVAVPMMQSLPAAESIVPRPQASKKAIAPPAEAASAAAPKPSVTAARSRAMAANADQTASRPADELAERRDAREATTSTMGAMNAAPLRGIISGAVTTGVAVANEGDAELKIVRADSSGIVRKTVIAAPAGVELTLTEFQAQHFAASGNRAAKALTEQQRQAQTPAPAVAAPTRAPVATGAASDLATGLSKSTVVHTITWIDSATGSRYTLSGPLSVDQLEALKPRILKLNR